MRTRAVALAELLPIACAALVAVLALVVLVSRSGGAARAAALEPANLATAPLTAVGLLLASASLVALHRRAGDLRFPSPLARTLGVAAALACAAIGAAVLAQYVVDWSAGPGRGTLVRSDRPWAQRPAPNTATSLILIGGALFALAGRGRRARRWAPRLATLAHVIALTAIVGHAYGARVLYGLNRLGGMALWTALALALLTIGIVFAEADRGFAAVATSDSSGGRMLRRLVPAAIVLPALLGWMRLRAQAFGLVDPAFGLALLVVSLIVVFATLVVSQASALHAFDTERARLHAAERTARAEADAAREAAERARQDADEANQAKSAFLATMSHEIRTPINAIVGYAQLIELGLAGPVTSQQRDYLARLAATSEHLRGLVDDVLDLAKIDAGGMSVARRPGMTGTLVATALDLVRPQASAKGVRLVDTRPGEPGEAFVGDEHRVRQILANLLSNAVKFTEAGGTITVACGVAAEGPPASEVHGGPWTYVTVRDTGIGIPPAEQLRIFEPFHQVDARHTRRQGGTGLGLAISRRLARLMGGELTVASEPGAGSTFTLWLPSSAERAMTITGEAARARQAGIERVRGFAEVGAHLRERIEPVIAAFGTRLRADPSIPRAAQMRRTELEDHQISFVGDIAQTLIVVEETGGPDSDILRDGSTIQRVISELHGAMRHRHGWTETQFQREYAILGEEIAAAVRAVAPDDAGDASLPLEVIARMMDRACVTGLAALRRAAESERAKEA